MILAIEWKKSKIDCHKTNFLNTKSNRFAVEQVFANENVTGDIVYRRPFHIGDVITRSCLLFEMVKSTLSLSNRNGVRNDQIAMKSEQIFFFLAAIWKLFGIPNRGICYKKGFGVGCQFSKIASKPDSSDQVITKHWNVSTFRCNYFAQWKIKICLVIWMRSLD